LHLDLNSASLFGAGIGVVGVRHKLDNGVENIADSRLGVLMPISRVAQIERFADGCGYHGIAPFSLVIPLIHRPGKQTPNGCKWNRTLSLVILAFTITAGAPPRIVPGIARLLFARSIVLGF